MFEKNDLLPIFEENNKTMETAMRSLNSFLEIKRQQFPRFYFLSNREVLDVLAVHKDPKGKENNKKTLNNNNVSAVLPAPASPLSISLLLLSFSLPHRFSLSRPSLPLTFVFLVLPLLYIRTCLFPQ